MLCAASWAHSHHKAAQRHFRSIMGSSVLAVPLLLQLCRWHSLVQLQVCPI